MNQSSFKRLATRTTHPFLKLKRSVLLVMNSAYNAFCYYINGYYSLPSPSSAVIWDAFCYWGHAHALYRRQGERSVLLVMYSAYNAFVTI